MNNGSDTIFSFFPISKHSREVGFKEYWETLTRNFPFNQGVSAFGLPYKSSSLFEAFKDAYRSSVKNGGAMVIKARVVGRPTNVDVHWRITQSAVSIIGKVLGRNPAQDGTLPIKNVSGKGRQHASNFVKANKVDVVPAPRMDRQQVRMGRHWQGANAEICPRNGTSF